MPVVSAEPGAPACDPSTELLWLDARGFRPPAEALITRLEQATDKGLDPAAYHAAHWSQRLAEGGVSPDACARQAEDKALSADIERYLHDLHYGRADLRSLSIGFDVRPKPEVDLDALLRRLAGGADADVEIGALEPPFVRYHVLLEVLRHYRALAADRRAGVVPRRTAKVVRPGDAYGEIPELATRLNLLGDLTEIPAPLPETYKGTLVEAVKSFQRHHGLTDDGVLGRDSFAALAVPLDQRVRQIELTLERWRWLPSDLGERPIVVNVPEFMLYGFDGTPGERHVGVKMRVVVGRSYPRYQTPLFEGKLRYLVFHPYWNVPYSILKREILPKVDQDPGYLDAHHYEIVSSFDPKAEALAETEENLAALAAGNLKLRQTPGAWNALGEIKFMFPNSHAVYFHGTPAKSLFRKDRRAFSHGCIRLYDPPRLARWVLADQSGVDVDALLDDPTRKRVNLKEPLDVYILYGTVQVTPGGEVFFLRDVYGHDRRLDEALRKTRPKG